MAFKTPRSSCIIGAISGAAIGAGAGAATTAVMTNNYNEEQARIFVEAWDRDIERQKKEIAEVEEWLKSNPDTQAVLREQAQSICYGKANWERIDKLHERIAKVEADAKNEIER